MQLVAEVIGNLVRAVKQTSRLFLARKAGKPRMCDVCQK